MHTIDEYFKTISEPEKAALERIRKIVHETVPEAEESYSYGMPAFKYKGKYLVNFFSFKDHLSLFPGALSDDIKQKLDGFKFSKGTIQFTLDHEIPETMIKEILLHRVNAISKS